jgi:hypothetical protein
MVLTRSATAAKPLIVASHHQSSGWPVVRGEKETEELLALYKQEREEAQAMKRKREQLEIEDKELDILEKKARIEAMTIANKHAVSMRFMPLNPDAHLALMKMLMMHS